MEFVTFEVAKKLKEKWYPQVKQNTLAMYDEDGKWYSMTEPIDTAYSFEFEDFDDRDCVCPTISQSLKWLREEKRIHIQILFTCPSTNWEYIIVKMINHEHCEACTSFASYEQAAIAGIEYVLDNLI